MYDHLYDALRDRRRRGRRARRPSDAQPARSPSCSRPGERIDVLATHSKYAPSQAAVAAPPRRPARRRARSRRWRRARSTSAASTGAQLVRCRGSIDVRVLWVRTDRVADRARHVGRAASTSDVVFGFPGRESGLFGTLLRARRRRAAARCSTTSCARPWPRPRPSAAIETLCRLAARAPARPRRLALRRGRRARCSTAGSTRRRRGRAAGARSATSPIADRLAPHLYPAGPDASGVATPAATRGPSRARAATSTARSRCVERLLGADAAGASTRRAAACARTVDALARGRAGERHRPAAARDHPRARSTTR